MIVEQELAKKTIWPCECCGSDMADTYLYDAKTGKVFKCSNCGRPKSDNHVDSEYCWCQPKLINIEKDGTQRWKHHALQ